MVPFDVEASYKKLQTSAIPATVATKTLSNVDSSKKVAGIAKIATSEQLQLLSAEFTKRNNNSESSDNSDDQAVDLSSLGVSLEYIDEVSAAESGLADLCQSELLAVDIETTGLDPHFSRIRLVQFYAGKSSVYVFDCFNELIWKRLTQSPAWNRPLVAHNAVFEIKHLVNAGISIPNIGCTMLQSNALVNNLPKLSQLVEKHLRRGLCKKQQVSDWSTPQLTKEQLEYAALDAVVTFHIANIQSQELLTKNRVSIYSMMKNAQKSIAKMELSGFLFDLEKHHLLVETWKDDLVTAQENLKEVLAGINPNSGQQVASWLENTLEKETLETWPRTAKGQLKTDISTFARYPELTATKPLLLFKNLSKKLSTYGEKYRRYVSNTTGRIHASYRIGGNVTGRIPCSNPNLQQVPRDSSFRSLFIAPPGRLLLVADYSQIQLRIAALLANDQQMRDAFISGEDLHRRTAAAILATSATNITKEQRQMGKAVSFGLLFGQGAEGLARYAKSAYGVEMSVEEAQEARQTFFKTYPGLARWQRTTGRQARIRNFVSTPRGRVRNFSRESGGYKFTESLNTPIQGAEAEILMSTLGLLSRRLDDSTTLVNIVHDELIFEISDSDIQSYTELIEQTMVEGFLKVFPDSLDMTKGLVEAHTGANWEEAK